MRKPLLGDIFILSIVIALLHYFSIQYSWYWQFPWMDIVVHFLSGAWVGGMLLWFVFVSGRVYVANMQHEKVYAFLFAVLGTLAAGLAWEAFEFASGVILIDAKVLFDSVLDIIMALLGGVVSYYYVLRKGYLG